MMNPTLIDDCFLHDKDRLRHDEALAILKAQIRPIAGLEPVKTGEAWGRILAESVIAPRDIPAHTNAAVDGYAFGFSAYDPQQGARLRICARITAGETGADPLPAAGAARIFTGAVMPPSADTVVMQEDTRLERDGGALYTVIPPGLKRGANRRLAGEDVKAGETVLVPGQKLRPQDIAAAASCGLDSLICHTPLRLAVFSSGNEIIRHGSPFMPGKVYDTNAPMLQALAKACGFECADLGILPDDAGVVAAELQNAASRHDVLITTGGASRGEEDHIVQTLNRLGSLHLWQLAIKPGRPMAFGHLGRCVVLVLPGNPVAAFICFLLYVRPVLTALAGGTWPEPRRFPLRADFAVATRKTGRREFWRGIYAASADGGVWARKYERDGSGLISSLRHADGLIEIGEDIDAIRRGDLIWFIPFSEFGL